jgi:uncharacterized small protein (DUF1192 family)
MDDELDRVKPTPAPADLQRWNIEDLEAYIDAMQREIAKVQAIVADKKAVQSAAAALFGKGGND